MQNLPTFGLIEKQQEDKYEALTKGHAKQKSDDKVGPHVSL